jgi:hypothetical protein
MLTCFMLLAVALPGFAAGPVITTFTQHIDDIFDCGSFEVLDSIDVTATRRTFFDEAGNPVKRQAHVSIIGTITNTTTGKSFTDRGSVNNLFDFEGGTLQQAGVNFHINVPGKGVVLLEAGKIVVDLATGDVLFKAGPTGSLDDLCAGLE